MQNEPMIAIHSLVRFSRLAVLVRVLPNVKRVPDARPRVEHVNARPVPPGWDQILRYKTDRGNYPQGDDDQRDDGPMKKTIARHMSRQGR